MNRRRDREPQRYHRDNAPKEIAPKLGHERRGSGRALPEQPATVNRRYDKKTDDRRNLLQEKIDMCRARSGLKSGFLEERHPLNEPTVIVRERIPEDVSPGAKEERKENDQPGG